MSSVKCLRVRVSVKWGNLPVVLGDGMWSITHMGEEG